MNDGMGLSREKVLLLVQRALLGSVTPNLRGVLVSWNEPANSILLKFFFECQPSALEIELISEIETEMLADFPEPVVVESEYCANTDSMTDDCGVWVYCRWEAQ